MINLKHSPVELSRLKGAFRILASPPILVVCIAILTGPFWMPVAIYFFLGSYRYVPSGLVPWVVILVTQVVGIWSLLKWFASLHQLAKDSKAAIAKLGVKGRRDTFAIFGPGHDHIHWYHAAFALSLQIAIPPVVAVALYQGIASEQTYRLGNGRWVKESREQSLDKILKALERRGIFTPLQR